jgi:regulation of enolase protein 1 (concanavalin A-like superfamily)
MNQNIRCRLEGDRRVVALKNGKIAAAVATVLIVCIISQIGLVAAAAGYQDEFASASLQSFWTFTNPSGTGSYSLTAHSDYLRITAAYNSKLSIVSGSNLNAPRMLQSVTSDFTATTYVTGSFTSANYRGGMVLWKDQNNFIRLEKYGNNQVLFYTIIGGTEAYTPPVSTTTSNNLYLRLQKTGTTITAFYSSDGSSWTTISSYTYSSSDPLQIGLFAINADSTASSFSADFDFFHITPYSTLSVLPEYPVGIFGAAAAIAGGYVFFKAKNRVKPVSF